MTDETADVDQQAPGEQQDLGEWVYLVDPAWQAENAESSELPPPTAVVGGWFAYPDGTTGPFRASPGYEPSGPGLATDPVDACLRLMAHGETDVDQLLKVICETMLEIAVDEEQIPVVVPAPDDAPSVMVVTAPAHRYRVNEVSWLEVSAKELADALPDEGVDVLINPGAPDSMRIFASSLKEAVKENAPSR